MLSPTVSDRAFTSPKLSKRRLADLVEVGMAHCSDRRLQQAREAFSTICSLAPQEPWGEIGLGLTCFAEGQFLSATRHYRRALQLNPLNAYAYALLGEAQIFVGDLLVARTSLRRACQLDLEGAYGRLAQNLLSFMETLPASQLK